MHLAKRLVSVVLILALASLAGSCATYHYEGAAAGGVLGGIAGAMLDHKNPWRGGVIGAALGGVLGATLADISARGAREAAETGKPVEYQTEDGRGVYRAEPVGYDAQTKCHKVQERIWEDGKLIKDEVKEVCESEKTEGGYFGEPAQAPEREYKQEGPKEERYEGRYEEYAVPEHEGGPPPWAPAHGYRAKHRYRYYPSSYVYFNMDRDVYYYQSAGQWVESPRLPANIYMDMEDFVVLDMDDEQPYKFHRDVVKRYPPGFKKKKGKGNWKGYY